MLEWFCKDYKSGDYTSGPIGSAWIMKNLGRAPGLWSIYHIGAVAGYEARHPSKATVQGDEPPRRRSWSSSSHI